MQTSATICCLLFGAALALLVGLTHSTSYEGKRKPSSKIHRTLEDISGDGRYAVEWEVDFDTKIITFDVSVATKGFVGFGISPAGGMTGADIFVAGIKDDGTKYSSDMHGVGDMAPVLDDHQDWTLISAVETDTHTNLKFSRPLDTCDKKHDVPITEDTISIIWSFGTTDDLGYHGRGNRGTVQVNLLDPPMPPVDTSAYDNWTINVTLTMPSVQTTYWCTIHKTPANYREPRHVIGFNTKLETPESVAHTHHFTVFKCTPPPGQTHEWFEQFIGHPGDDCYTQRPLVPIEYCRTTLYIWAVGGKPLFLPEDMGYPILEDTTVEYVMLDVHYNNPGSLVGVEVPTSVELFNTKEMRSIDANILNVFHSINYANLIPPKVENFLTVTHCASECTENALQPGGIKLVNLMFHAHLLGRKMKLRHFRGNTELPWILVDDHYDFDFQQSRPLRKEVPILPGDHLTVECTYNSMERDGVTIGGYQSQEEMCQAIIWYYPRDAGGLACGSNYDEKKILERFGIESISQPTEMDPPIVEAPPNYAGKTFMEVVDNLNYWTPTSIAEFQKDILTEHVSGLACPLSGVKYPQVDKEYAPVDTCDAPGPTTTAATTTTGAGNPIARPISVFWQLTVLGFLGVLCSAGIY